MRTETGEVINSGDVTCGLSTGDVEGGNLRNNYSRPEGQNVGNFISDRPTSRVLAAPGGASSIVFGEDSAPAAQAPRTGRAPGALAPSSDHQMSSNNYSRPDGQNCGNFLTDRKVRAGGACPAHAHAFCTVGALGMEQHADSPAAARQALQSGSSTQPSSLPHSLSLLECCIMLQAVKVHAPPGGASQIHFG